MHSSRIQLSSVVFLLAMFINTVVLAADGGPITRVHRGTVVTVSADQIVTQGSSGQKKEHTYTVAPTVAVTCEAKPCKLTDIRAGERVTITTEKQQDGKAIATKIEVQKANS
ncbi:MAG TPA: hypothetical protein VKK81_08740 [Candidatus Binatia bacterium]|nr:hypothetical protein [Candidatus Binatia bacterium]